MNWRGVDLNLLLVLQVLLVEKHVSKAAEKLHMTQPTVSRALSRLRDQSQDPLLVRSRSGYELTERARQLQPTIEQMLQDASKLYQSPIIEPQNLNGEITLSSLDDGLMIFLPNIRYQLERQAPGIHLNAQEQWGRGATPLANGEVDMVIESILDLPQGFYAEPLLSSEWVCVMDVDNPLAAGDFSIEDFAAAKHGLVSLSETGSHSPIDDFLQARGLSRKVVLRVPHFSVIPYLVEQSQLIFTLPALVVEHFNHTGRLHCRPVPFELPDITYSLIWHKRKQHDPVQNWVRQAIIRSCQELGENL